MTTALRQLCALAVFCGALMSVTPEGGVKKITAAACTTVLLLSLVSALRELEPESLSLELARYHEFSEQLREKAAEERDRLDRRVIEGEYAAYICDEAERLGAPGLSVAVTARWDLSGFWLPYEVRLSGVTDGELRARLNERIEAELGISAERIIWDHES